MGRGWELGEGGPGASRETPARQNTGSGLPPPRARGQVPGDHRWELRRNPAADGLQPPPGGPGGPGQPHASLGLISRTGRQGLPHRQQVLGQARRVDGGPSGLLGGATSPRLTELLKASSRKPLPGAVWLSPPDVLVPSVQVRGRQRVGEGMGLGGRPPGPCPSHQGLLSRLSRQSAGRQLPLVWATSKPRGASGRTKALVPRVQCWVGTVQQCSR